MSTGPNIVLVKRTCRTCYNTGMQALDYSTGRWTCGVCGQQRRYSVHHGKSKHAKGKDRANAEHSAR